MVENPTLPKYQREKYRNTPNVEFLDEWLVGLYQRYEYKNLKDMNLEDLHAEEWELKGQFTQIRTEYPPQESMMQGAVRAGLLGNSNERREALTKREKQRLDQAKRDLLQQIRRARGHIERKQRNKILRMSSDISGKVLDVILKLFKYI
jgi:hypothetical protein